MAEEENGMTEYLPVPVVAAQNISECYQKNIVIILSWDAEHGLLHTTTYGQSQDDKRWAADGGVIASKALGIDFEAAKHFEDFRDIRIKTLETALAGLMQYMGSTVDADDTEKRNGTMIEDVHVASKRFMDAYDVAVDALEPK